MRRNTAERGFTVVEVILMVSIVAIILGAVTFPMRGGREAWQTGDRHAEVMQNALIGMDKMTRDIKQSQYITSVSLPSTESGYIEFVDGGGVTRKFQYASAGEGSDGYLEYITYADDGSVLSQSPLAGPINKLKFTCYQEDGAVPTTIPHKIGVVRIQLNTYDTKGKVANIPLTSKVRVNSDISGQGGGDSYKPVEYAIYGAAGIDIKNGAVVTSPDPINLPANIGALYDLIWAAQNVIVDGDVITGGELHLDNVSLTCQDVFVNENVRMDNNSGVSGNVNTNGDVIVYGNVGGYINLPPDKTIVPANYAGPVVARDGGGVPYKKFFNPLPDPTYTVDTFPAPGMDISIPNNGTQALAPGSYGNLRMDNNTTLRLQPGTYWFSSIATKNSGCSVTLDLNLTPDPGNVDPVLDLGGIQIFVRNDVNLTNLSLSIATKNNYTFAHIAQRFYMETLRNWSIGTKNGERWCGTVFAPIQNDPNSGNITLVNADLAGALFAGGEVILKKPGVNVVYIKADSRILPW